MNLSEFNRLVKDSSRRVVIVGAEWCKPCDALSKNIEQILVGREHLRDRIIKLDVDKEVHLSEDLNIQSVPTIFFIGNGSGERKTGSISASKIVEFFDG